MTEQTLKLSGNMKEIPLVKGVAQTLEERGKRYGNFEEHAAITQQIKEVMHLSLKWHTLSCDQKEALDMTAHKIGRILNGDPDYIDSWHDIQGYIKLVEDRLTKEQQNDTPV
jgi:uncharacterized protein (UPF0297 family)